MSKRRTQVERLYILRLLSIYTRREVEQQTGICYANLCYFENHTLPCGLTRTEYEYVVNKRKALEMKRKGWTLREIGDKLGVSHTHICKIMNESRPELDNADLTLTSRSRVVGEFVPNYPNLRTSYRPQDKDLDKMETDADIDRVNDLRCKYGLPPRYPRIDLGDMPTPTKKERTRLIKHFGYRPRISDPYTLRVPDGEPMVDEEEITIKYQLKFVY